MKKKLTQMQMADMLGVSRLTVINWEKGRNFPDNYNLERIADVFGIKVGELISG